LVDKQRFDHPGPGRRQQLREQTTVVAAGSAKPEYGVHVHADHVAARREPNLALASQQNIPGLVLLSADQGVLA
jgi:hypothetical protein